MPGRRRSAVPRTPQGSAISAPGTPSSGRGTNGQVINGEQMCDCKPPLKAVLRETQKPGRNKGRWFYTCPRERRRQCSMFVWEDYTGAARTAGASSMPRPTYRTSIGQRTTPPAERIGDPGTAPRSSGMQRPLPPPPPVSQSTGAGRRRTFTTALDGVYYDDTVMRDGDYSSDDEPVPPTPTPARTRRVGRQVASQLTQSDTKAADRSASGSDPEEPGHAAQPDLASNRITKYFGIVKKDQQRGVGIKQERPDPPSSSELSHAVWSQEQPPSSATTAASGPCSPLPTQAQAQAQSQAPTPGSASTVRPAPRGGPFPADYSDSEFDSETDRAMAALADDCEQSLQRKKSREDGVANASTVIETEQDTDREDMDIEGARSVIVPVLPASQGVAASARSTRSNSARRQRSEESASKKVAIASDAASTLAGAADGGHESTFAAPFNGGRSQPRHLLQQPLPSGSFPSSAMASSQASTVALSQVPDLTQSFATVATSPSTSFRRDAAADGAMKRKRARDERAMAWYDNGTQGASSDEDDRVTAIAAEDPFNDTPSKRARFHGAVAARTASSQSRDHNVTRAVLQLLEGQFVENRVLQQVRALLNTSFEDYES